jgi:hypothetical protein
MNEEVLMSMRPSWGHIDELIHLNHDQTLVSKEMLAERVLIAERMHRYGWAFDERQEEALSECFTESATWQASIMGKSNLGPFNGRSEVMNFMKGYWPNQLDQRRHNITNVIVESQSEKTANILASLVLMSASEQSLKPVTTGFYRVEMVKLDGLWKIQKLLVGFDLAY